MKMATANERWGARSTLAEITQAEVLRASRGIGRTSLRWEDGRIEFPEGTLAWSVLSTSK